MRYVRAFLDLPPSPFYHYWGSLPADLNEWIQPTNSWRLILYGHQGVVRHNATTIAYDPTVGVLFPPGSRGLHFVGGPDSVVVTSTFQLASEGQRPVALPIAFNVPHGTYEAMRMAVDRVNEGADRGRAAAWNLLWMIAEPTTALRAQSRIYEAEEEIRAQLRHTVGVSDLAVKLGVSQKTLLSWFRQEHGTTVQGYIRQTRVREACRLLATTGLTVKQVAARVGVTDLHQFNKLIRGEVGLSPRAFRMQSALHPGVINVFEDLAAR